MKIDKSHFVSGGIGALLGACAVWGVDALSDDGGSVVSSFFRTDPGEVKKTMYEKVEADLEGDVYITPNGKKYHNPWCYVLRQADEKKQASRPSVISVGYTPCKKCKP